VRVGAFLFIDSGRTARGGDDLEAYVKEVRGAAERGFASVWSAQVFGLDALTAVAIAGREVSGIGFGTAVVPTYTRHPQAMAQAALTTQIAAGGRLTLGVGLSHRFVVEDRWGYSFDKPVRHMREYLSALMPFLAGEDVDVQGETVKASGRLPVPEGLHTPVVVAALGTQMLRLAGRVADGTVTWMAGPDTVGNHIAPTIVRAASDAGRPPPRVVVALPVAVTDDEGAARSKAAHVFAMYGNIPSYRAMLDREGVDGPADVAIVGDQAAVTARINELFERGATEFVGSPFDNRERTLDTLAALAGGQ
jgi:F420-dependent oxidoreductase-like protein